MPLSQEEIALLNDTQFLFLKNVVSEKIVTKLRAIEKNIHKSFTLNADESLQKYGVKTAKISKGEQYQGLPYFVLDYPRYFTRDEVVAFRVMLWWGKFLSCTLHLQGEVIKTLSPALLDRFLDDPNIYFCINDNPWEYHYEDNNYQQLINLNPEAINKHLEEKGFLKLSTFIPIDRWKYYDDFVSETFARFLVNG
jgi:hypothetical protein